MGERAGADALQEYPHIPTQRSKIHPAGSKKNYRMITIELSFWLQAK